MTKRLPRVLLDELAETSRRAARAETCPRCGADVLRGDDHDKVAMRATVDADPVDDAAEMVAVIEGRPTYDLLPVGGKARGLALHYREPWHYLTGRDYGGGVHVAHRCTKGSNETRNDPVLALWD